MLDIIKSSENYLLDDIASKIMTLCEKYKIRLTPSEYEQLINNYVSKCVDNIDLGLLMQLAENIVRQNGN